MAEPRQCRICLGEEGDDLISPCRCRGGSQYVHRACLQAWRQSNQGDAYYQCNVCLFRYRFHRLWWGQVLESRWTSGLIAVCALVAAGWISGQVSAWVCNFFWAYFEHESTEVQWQPHRLQVLFHGLFWLAIPGFVLLVWDLVNLQPGPVQVPVQAPLQQAWSGPSVVHHHVHHERPEERKSKEDGGNDSKSGKKSRVVPYKSPSFGVWVLVGVGAARLGLGLFRYTHSKCREWCVNAQQLVENVF